MQLVAISRPRSFILGRPPSGAGSWYPSRVLSHPLTHPPNSTFYPADLETHRSWGGLPIGSPRVLYIVLLATLGGYPAGYPPRVFLLGIVWYSRKYTG